MAQTLEELLAIRAIEQQIIGFARAMDAHDWDGLRAIMTDDFTGHLGEGPISGPQAVIDTISRYLDRCGVTQHLIGNIVVTLDPDSATRATSRAYVRDVHLPADNSSETFYTLGDYEDTWELREGTWRMVGRIKHNRAPVGSVKRVFGF